jgi:hypothetical protein
MSVSLCRDQSNLCDAHSTVPVWPGFALNVAMLAVFPVLSGSCCLGHAVDLEVSGTARQLAFPLCLLWAQHRPSLRRPLLTFCFVTAACIPAEPKRLNP